MTTQERDYGEVLSRVLHSTTDQIEPVGDGLTKIRARIAEPWLKRRWWLLQSEFMVVGWVLTVRCQSWLSAVRARSAAWADGDSAAGAHAAITPGAGRMAAAGRGARPRSRVRPALDAVVAWATARRPHEASAAPRRPVGPTMAWLRPALAAAGAIVLVVAGVFALGQIRESIVSLSDGGGLTPGTSGPAGQLGSTDSNGGQPVPGGQSPTNGSVTSGQPGSSPRSSAASSPAACATTPPPPITSPTPKPTTPTPTPDPTPTTPTPTPSTGSPSPSTSSGLTTGGMAIGRAQAIRTTALLVCGPTAPAASPSNQARSAP
jgi:hypothetical protein